MALLATLSQHLLLANTKLVIKPRRAIHQAHQMAISLIPALPPPELGLGPPWAAPLYAVKTPALKH